MVNILYPFISSLIAYFLDNEIFAALAVYLSTEKLPTQPIQFWLTLFSIRALARG
jgi:hypothetical protein